MPDSLFAPDFQTVLNRAKRMSGQDKGPFPSPEDWRDQWIYFLMVDRFNNPKALPRHQPFDDPNFFSFQGGKFSGVRQRLGYIKQLGAGAIWLSPRSRIFRSRMAAIMDMASTTSSVPSRGLQTRLRMQMTSCEPWSMRRTRRVFTSSLTLS